MVGTIFHWHCVGCTSSIHFSIIFANSFSFVCIFKPEFLCVYDLVSTETVYVWSIKYYFGEYVMAVVADEYKVI